MRQIHEYAVDRATNTARLGATNPARKYIRGEDAQIQVQLARGEVRFYDQGGQPLDIAEVPEDVLDALRLNPLRRGNETVEQVLQLCEFCTTANGDPTPIASSEWESHLKAHIRASALSSRKLAGDQDLLVTTPTALAQGRAAKPEPVELAPEPAAPRAKRKPAKRKAKA